MSWLLSIAIAITILAIIIMISVSDKFAYIFETIFYLGAFITILTFLVHWIFFD